MLEKTHGAEKIEALCALSIGSLESLSTIDDSRARSLWSALVLLAVVESALLEATTIRANNPNKQAKQRGSKKESLRFVSKLFQLIKHAN